MVVVWNRNAREVSPIRPISMRCENTAGSTSGVVVVVAVVVVVVVVVVGGAMVGRGNANWI